LGYITKLTQKKFGGILISCAEVTGYNQSPSTGQPTQAAANPCRWVESPKAGKRY
jgi:hypothetical protein